MVLLYLHRYDDALAAAHEAISIRADTPLAFGVIQQAYLCKGMREEQLAEQRLRIAGDGERLAAFDHGLAECGYECAQRAVAGVLARRYQKGLYGSAFNVALRYLDAGDLEEALQWLYRAYESHDQYLPYLGGPVWGPLYGDARYQALLRRVGLPQPGVRQKRTRRAKPGAPPFGGLLPSHAGG